MIELNNVKVYYGNYEVIKGVSARINEKVILLGPNGSGKTTLLRAIAGIIPYKGSIKVDGMEVRDIKNYNVVATNLWQAFSIGITVEDAIEVYEEYKGLKFDVREELRKLGIDYKKKWYTLSSGQRVVASTLLALATDPKIVLIDEPFENVDVYRRRALLKFLKEYGKEGIIVTHEVYMLKYFAGYKVFLILDGKVFGPLSVEELLSSSLVSGEDPSALLVIEAYGKKVSLVKSDKGYKIENMGIIEEIYSLLI